MNQSGVYKLTVSQASCTAIDSVEVRVNPFPSVLPDEITCQDKPLIASSTDSNLTYLWELSGERSREISVVDEGVYRVKITNQFGCSKTRTFTVAGPCSASISAPDIFTPNGDGINDTFKLFISGGTPVKLIIYNRWGNPVFSSKDSNPEWDGKLKEGDVLNGRYAYVLEYKTLTSSDIQKHWGVIHIER